MKVSDLMIGDWVNIMVEGYDNPTQIKEIGTFWVKATQDEKDYGIGLIEPIPITPEILEKNGFYFGYTSNEEDIASCTIAQLSEEDKGWVWDEGDGTVKAIFPNESDGGLISIDDQSDKYLEFVFANQIYVHDLQHALKLCGISKNIEL